MPRTQANRLIAVNTSLGEDVMLLKSFTLMEELGRPFSCELDLRSEQHDIKFEDIVGHNVTIRVALMQGGERYINGHVSRFAQEGHASKGRLNQYRATVVPWLWFLTRSSDCRIFQEMSIPDIVQQVFRDHGFSEFRLSLSGTYNPREYVVQYRETAFNFVSRLLEHEGIYYFFEHEDGKHTLVLADSPSAHEPAAGAEEIPYVQQSDSRAGRERIWEWMVEKRLQSEKVALNDFDFIVPTKDLNANRAVTRGHAGGGFEVFDYPGDYIVAADGTEYVRIRSEQLGAAYETVRGKTDSRPLCLGSKFKLTEYTREDQLREYVVTSVVTHAETDDFGESDAARAVSGGGGGKSLFQSTFSAIEAVVPFRPAMQTPRPRVAGPQTAIVVGRSGEEIDTDEHGRVKVHFHWDRHNPADETASCWVRVSQNWAGKKWGGLFLPRIGQEVIVDFLEGDPDKPIITGRVYNGDNTPPYALPDNKTMTTVKSNSSKGGGGFNEIRFEDKKDSEQIFVHAQKDIDIRILNDRKEFVGNDRHLIVKHDRIDKVENDRHDTVTRDHVTEIGRDRHLKVSGKQASEVVGSLSLKVSDDVIEEFEKNQSTQVTKDLYIKAANICIEAETNITIKVGGSSIAIESGGISLKTDGDIELTATGKIVQKATADVTIEATANGSFKGTAGLKLESPAMAELKSASTTVKGDGMVTIQGGLVKIN